jgi:phosphoheptose isomerase
VPDGDGRGPGDADARRVIARTFAETVRLHERVAELDPDPILAAVELILGAFGRGAKVLAFGNGGSAADAQHFAAEFVGRYLRERRGLSALALSSDPSVVTAIANDYGFDRVFARQVEAIGRMGDVAVGISTSGRSANVAAGLEAARRLGLATIALTGGDGGRVGRAAEVHINVPDASTPRVQEVHRTLLHVICELVEARVANAL